jgi:hypothetical protein
MFEMFEQIGLSVFLFCTVFSFLCCLQHRPADRSAPAPIEQQLREAFALMDEAPVGESQSPTIDTPPDNPRRSSAPSRRTSVRSATKKDGKPASTEQSPVILAEIDLESLPLRPHAKCAGRLVCPRRLAASTCPSPPCGGTSKLGCKKSRDWRRWLHRCCQLEVGWRTGGCCKGCLL